MKFHVLLFFSSLALTAAVPFPTQKVVAYSEIDDFLDKLAYYSFDDEPKTEIGKILKGKFDEVLEKVKDAIESGKVVDEETIEKLKEYREQLKSLNIGVAKHADELLDSLKDKVKEYWKNIWKKLEFGDTFSIEDEPKTEIGKILKGKFDEVLEKVKDAIESGKVVDEETIEKLKEYREQLKSLNISVGKHADELLDSLKDKVKEYWKNIWKKLEFGWATFFVEDEPKTEIGKKLKEKFDEILEKVRDAIESGKEVKEETIEKLKEYREQLKDLDIGVGKHADELLDSLKDKVKEYWKKIWDKLMSDD